ncbi:LysR family transcriptional regulator [Actinopolymorpha pittospori]|uniref:DNA-binding transcriptional LysR family regulator n=1 Tax=Actinopolymorpha pittospori TaxID=648752 RepID=A0A927REU1_9ACTN|nr:LysR family transcriptional regulator [Actinopolymorpha pittospori]MBE1612574.1 DNA-binding transcriptional LysR family regulator [Actinopolymorpha pittospori]
MELYQLRSFVAVADEMHVGRAAARLHQAQPTLSRQIAALERDVGVELFSRARRRLTLTSAGEVFLASAREILRRADVAAQDARRAARGEVGTLRVGFVQSATFEVFPRLVGQFRKACPDVRLEARFMTTLQQVSALRAGHLDVGILRPQQPSTAQTGLRTRVLSQDRLMAVLPAAHPMAGHEHVPLSALAEDDFILYPNEKGATGHELILEHCRSAGFSPRIIQEAADAQTIVALVAANLGVSLLLSPTPPTDPGLVVYRSISDELPTWDLALAWSSGNSSAVLDRFLAVPGAEGEDR